MGKIESVFFLSVFFLLIIEDEPPKVWDLGMGIEIEMPSSKLAIFLFLAVLFLYIAIHRSPKNV